MALTIRLGSPLETRLDALAKRTGRTKTFYIRELIKDGIDDLEDRYAAHVREGAQVKQRITGTGRTGGLRNR
jgi:predicted DNA-binding protein